VLNIVRHDVEVRGRPDDLPDHIDVDLTGLEIGDSVHINSIALPAGIKPTIARNFTICTIAPPTVMTAEEETPAAAATPAEGEAAAAAAPGAAPAAPGAAPGAAAAAAPAKGGEKKK
jgi:large subunit ribosomal protein L25